MAVRKIGEGWNRDFSLARLSLRSLLYPSGELREALGCPSPGLRDAWQLGVSLDVTACSESGDGSSQNRVQCWGLEDVGGATEIAGVALWAGDLGEPNRARVSRRSAVAPAHPAARPGPLAGWVLGGTSDLGGNCVFGLWEVSSGRVGSRTSEKGVTVHEDTGTDSAQGQRKDREPAETCGPGRSSGQAKGSMSGSW